MYISTKTINNNKAVNKIVVVDKHIRQKLDLQVSDNPNYDIYRC